jgi:hypothetical protein
MESSASKSESPLPDSPELRALEEAFEAGNYRKVREGAARIASSDEAGDVKEAARTLKERTEASRAQIALLAITAALVVALSGYEIVEHGRNAPRPAPPRTTIERVTK